jgi:hypothetical protein
MFGANYFQRLFEIDSNTRVKKKMTGSKSKKVIFKTICGAWTTQGSKQNRANKS